MCADPVRRLLWAPAPADVNSPFALQVAEDQLRYEREVAEMNELTAVAQAKVMEEARASAPRTPPLDAAVVIQVTTLLEYLAAELFEIGLNGVSACTDMARP